MFNNGDCEDYDNSFSFCLPKQSEGIGKGVDTSVPVSIVDIEPPSAEKMLQKLRQKLKGKGLKEI